MEEAHRADRKPHHRRRKSKTRWSGLLAWLDTFGQTLCEVLLAHSELET